MLRRLIIVGGAILIIAAVVLVVRYDEIHHAEGKGYDIKCTQSSEPSATTGSLICTAEHSQKAKSGESDSPWWHVFFTWPEGITALAVILTLGAITWQAFLMRKHAKHFEKLANHIVTSERAWIITPPAVRNPKLIATGTGTVFLNVFDLVIKNSGKTPTHLLELSLTYCNMTKAEWDGLPSEPEYEYVSMGGLLLVPTDSIGRRAVLTPSGGILSEQELSGIENADRFLYAFGSVRYRDAFENTREMRFGYMYYFPQGGRVGLEPAGFERLGPEAYNRAT